MRVWRVNDLHQSTPRGRQKCRLSLTIEVNQRGTSVLSNVQRIMATACTGYRCPVYGYVYDVKNGRLVEVPEASKAGRAA